VWRSTNEILAAMFQGTALAFDYKTLHETYKLELCPVEVSNTATRLTTWIYPARYLLHAVENKWVEGWSRL
jgi:hypothetical protein